MLKVGKWTVDPDLGRLHCGEEEAFLQPQVAQLLLFLAKYPGELVSIEQMIDKVWAGKPMTTGSVYNALNALRNAFGDNKDNPEYIETIPRRGYRLIADVEWLETGFSTDTEFSRTPVFSRTRVILLSIFALLGVAWILSRALMH